MARTSVLTYKSLILLCLAAVAAAMLNRLDARFDSKGAHGRMVHHPKRTVTPNPPQCKRRAGGTSPESSISSTNTGTGTTKTTDGSPSATSQAPPAVTGNLPSFLVGTQTGDGTFYGIGLGSCGWTNGGDDLIAAVSWKLYDNFPGYKGGNPNNNPVCGRKVTAQYNGKSTHVTIVDRCTGCDTTDLDFSPAAFAQLADFAVGRIHGVKWNWD